MGDVVPYEGCTYPMVYLNNYYFKLKNCESKNNPEEYF